MKKLANKMITMTFIGLPLAFFTLVSIPISFKLWHFKGLIFPMCGIFTLFYIAIRIELIRRKCHIHSYYDLSMRLADKEPAPNTTLIEEKNFHALGSLYAMISAVTAIIVLFLSFCFFG